jgi:hypothetical protein
MPNWKAKVSQWILLVPALVQGGESLAAEFEPMGKALQALLKTTKVKKKAVQIRDIKSDAFYSQNDQQKLEKLAVIEKGIYEPNCTHTWAIGLDGKTGQIEEIRVIEMSCPHAYPTREQSFLSQFIGKGPKDAPTLKKKVDTVAKATGSSDLTTDAVVRSIEVWKTFQQP